ncbi:unnamed protein product [Psylliodes chrysocephalus]|uniref:Invertebrate defensins family profile domain-containing protein n=1 Tax=Psylliodes chrysocephalus TaxID=3402493 RepID=A0A9P0CU54_9CUCU|nr:unnamed protein product [Psylliodes chrysocephala]
MKIVFTCLFVIFAMNAIGLIEEAEGGVVSCTIGKLPLKVIQLNDAACAAKCLLQRHKGGYCEGVHCRCRD